MMDKTELLFLMLEQPEHYSEEQWYEVLADEECRQLYTMLSKVQSAVDEQRIGENLSKEEIDQEWDKFRNRHRLVSDTPQWGKIAAAAAIAIICVSLAIAAVHHAFSSPNTSENDTANVESVITTPETAEILSKDVQSDEVQPHLYDNVPLEQIINDMSAYYNVQVEWRSDEARDLRLYYQWEPSFTLDMVVDMLNSFEAINITREGDKIIIKQAE